MVGLLTLGALTATVVALLRFAPIGATVGILTGAAGIYWLYNAERNRTESNHVAEIVDGEIRARAQQPGGMTQDTPIFGHVGADLDNQRSHHGRIQRTG